MPVPVQRVELEIAPRQWRMFRSELLNVRRDGEELLGLMFCSRHDLPDGTRRLLPKNWVVPLPECYDVQGVAGLELNQDVHRFLMESYCKPGMDVVHIHTHPGQQQPEFSSVDDHHERRYAEFLRKLDPPSWLVSGVFNQEMELSRFRAWAPLRSWSGSVTLSGGWDHAPTNVRNVEFSEAAIFDGVLDRQRIFGLDAQARLGRLHIGLIGCGGIGAVFAEQAARLGVRNWTLIDPDRLEETNLNRMPFTNRGMARQGWTKVRYVRRLIERMWPVESNIREIRASVEVDENQTRIAECDLLVVATDNHQSRLVAQRVASMYARPMMSLGTHIEVRNGVGAQTFARVTLPPVDGGWCLVCGEVIDPGEAARETAAAPIAQTLRSEGYLRDVAAPAVYWLNSVAASFGVGVLHGVTAGFTNADQGLDWVFSFQSRGWTNIVHDESDSCLFCSHDGYWGNGKLPSD